MNREKMIEAITTAILGKTATKAAAAVLELMRPKRLRDAAACLGHITRFEDIDAILALIPAYTPAPAKVTLGFLRPIWKDHSGEWHGPKVERWSIPEDQMVTFFNAALRAIAGEKP